MPLPRKSHQVALVVMVVNGEMALCPFFAKCDGLLIVDRDNGKCEFLPKTRPTSEAMCNLILETDADRLILGFIPGPAARKLQAAGLDIRLGSCACPVEELAACFDHLPTA
jgi:hypothetical protein